MARPDLLILPMLACALSGCTYDPPGLGATLPSSLKEACSTGASYNVAITASRIDPPVLTTHSGDTVTWVNRGEEKVSLLFPRREARRMVTANPSRFQRQDGGLGSSRLAPGEAASLCVYRAGRFQYDVHGVGGEATGVLVVEEPGR